MGELQFICKHCREPVYWSLPRPEDICPNCMNPIALDVDPFEWGIVHKSDIGDTGNVKESHRSGMTEAEARTWQEEFVNEGGAPEAFLIIRRPISPWEVVEND